MENTGRIRKTLDGELARIVFGANVDAAIDDELPWMTEIDRAHVVMLVEAGLMKPGAGAQILEVIAALRRAHFAPLRGKAAPRGLYLLYEHDLVSRLGNDVGGALHTGRSRNDLSATVLRMRLRRPVLELIDRLTGLCDTLADRAGRFAELVMPIYTHFQAALPVSLGHYCSGAACALVRDLEGVIASASELDTCPLGAGAVGGSSLPIRPARTAQLLGFTAPVRNSIDAVASRDLVLRIVAAAAVLGVTLSRIASDLLLWTTAEFGFLQLPDELVGSSSMMPQKRNPFLLEHVVGRASSPLGAFMLSCTAMHGTPFSNSIAVGTEAMRPLWSTLRDVTEAVILLRAVIEGMSPDEQAMERRARDGYVCATRLAEWLVVHRDVAFRDAHHAVGELINRAIAEAVPLPGIAARAFDASALETELEPRAACRAARYGGGPGGDGIADALAQVERSVAQAREWRTRREQRWREATRDLDDEVGRRMAGAAEPQTQGGPA